MALSVIGAGFGRTGTESMKLALEQLGVGPCHHMKEVLVSPEQIEIWTDIAYGAAPDWALAFAGFNSAIDWPSAFYWRELSEVYPEAGVILTLRDAVSWYESFSKTILRYLDIVHQQAPDRHLGQKIIAGGVFDGRAGDPGHAKAMFERNTAEVMAAIPPERLLVYNVGDGWEPLCRFLDCPVPDTPFPRANSTADFQELLHRLQEEGH
jgi:sulfotransferase family protein